MTIKPDTLCRIVRFGGELAFLNSRFVTAKGRKPGAEHYPIGTKENHAAR